MDFTQLGLSAAILKALTDQGYQAPTPIQAGAIPPALAGRDVLGIAQTGTGKTCAFATPILQRLAAAPQRGPRVIRSLILTPTRELALQIQESFESYGANLPLTSAVIFGGVGQGPQVEKLRRGVDILVATPGRLLDLQGQGLLDLSHIEIFVLDEADRMLDMGFIHDVRRVLKLLPVRKQTLFFSATMPAEVQGLVSELLHDPARVAVTPVSSPVEVIRQSLYYVDKANKTKLLAYLVDRPEVKNALVFSRTKHGANKVAGELVKAGISAAAIHGNKSQTARQQALADFKTGRVKVLVATDIAARGIDIEELSHVFNYNLPDVPETYVHRIGRTGRAGHGGTAISFCDISEKEDLKGIEKLLGKPIPVAEGHPWPMVNLEPPQRDKHGKIVNPEDAEARQAARERKREGRRAGPDGQARGQEPRRAVSASDPGVTAPGKAKPSRPAPAPAAREPVRERTPGQKRQAAGYKASKTLDAALHAMAPKSAAPREEKKSERDLAFEAWMAEERRIQAQQGYTDPLAGEEIMDATARLLAPKREGRRAGPGGAATGQKQAKAEGLSGILAAQPRSRAESASNPSVTAPRGERGHGSTPSASSPSAAAPKAGRSPAAFSRSEGKRERPCVQPERDSPSASSPSVTAPRGGRGHGSTPSAVAPKGEGRHRRSAPAKPAPAQREEQAQQGRKTARPAQGEERRGRAEAQRPRRERGRGPIEPTLRPSSQKDSTEQRSLMKPYYLNDD